MKNRKLNISKKTIIIILVIPVIFISQYYFFKFGILDPQIKGIEITVIEGKYIKDIDKYVIKLDESVVLSAGDYVKFPSYAKDPVVDFKGLDEDNKVKIQNNSENIENTVKVTGMKEGLTSVAVVKNNKILKKFNILVVNPKVVNLNTEVDGTLRYVGDTATIKNYVEVDFDRFNEKYNVEYKSSNENVLKIEGNKVHAVGIGKATITANLDSKKEAFDYNIVARLKSINVDKNIVLEVGDTKNIGASVVTFPKNLKTPKIKYVFAENKLPVQRKVRLDSNGNIVGLRSGKEKILVSCGTGKNKVEKYVYVKVNETNIENKEIQEFYVIYYFMEDALIMDLEWNELNGAEEYQIYIKDNKIKNGDYELIKTINKDNMTKKDKKINDIIIIKDKKDVDIDYDIYVVARNKQQISQKSRMYNVKIP